MNPLRHHRTRRANADDLPQLIALWRAENLPVDLLEKQLTDFQVLESPDGVIVAAIALQVSGSHGRIHGESIGDFALADGTRALLWQQLQTTARSLGLFRLWTRAIPPFWRKDAGFTEPDPEALAKLPAEFATSGAPWLALRLRDEAADPEVLAKQFEVFKVTEQQKREQTLFIARVLGILGTVIALMIFVTALIFLIRVWKHR